MAEIGETMKCQRCGKEVVRNTARQRFCAECRLQHERERAKVYREQIKTEAREGTRPVKCVQCGQVFYTAAARAKYCTVKCHDAARKERDAAKTAQGRIPADNIWRIGALARANGMSYGKLMAAVQAAGGKLPKGLKRPPECRGAYIGGRTI